MPEIFQGLRASPDGLREAMLAHVRARGRTYLFWADGDWRFRWVCPGCGLDLDGVIGERPVSGWDAPRWVNTGTRERPTLAPSLGCPRWRHGICQGHWWLRNGILVPA